MRFYGVVGYGDSVQEPAGSGKYKQTITERPYYGDVVHASSQAVPGDKVNDDITVSNSISIVADDFAVGNFMHIKYVEWAGTRWKVTHVEDQRPRLILSLGSVYNGPTP